jgi:hypothetical protein
VVSTSIHLISASQIARFTGMSHRHLAEFLTSKFPFGSFLYLLFVETYFPISNVFLAVLWSIFLWWLLQTLSTILVLQLFPSLPTCLLSFLLLPFLFLGSVPCYVAQASSFCLGLPECWDHSCWHLLIIFYFSFHLRSFWFLSNKRYSTETWTLGVRLRLNWTLHLAVVGHCGNEGNCLIVPRCALGPLRGWFPSIVHLDGFWWTFLVKDRAALTFR